MLSTAAHLTYYQVFRPFVFHHNNMIFSLTVLCMVGVGPSPLAGSSTSLVAPKLTDNATVTPKLFTPRALFGSNFILNLAPPTGLKD